MPDILSEVFITGYVHWSIYDGTCAEIHKHMLYLGYFLSEEAIETKLGESHLWCYVLKSSDDSLSLSCQS